MICPNPNCGYQGQPNREPRGNRAVLLVLLFLCVLPGALYALLASGYRYKCPKCGLQVAADN